MLACVAVRMFLQALPDRSLPWNPAALRVLAWTASLAICCGFIAASWRKLTLTIHDLVDPAEGRAKRKEGPDLEAGAAVSAPDDAYGSARLAGAVAALSVLGIAVSIGLFVFDYQAHMLKDAPAAQDATGFAAIVQDFARNAGPHLGTFGDFFGGVLNPLLTLATLAGLAVTILMQRVQIREARLEAQRNNSFAHMQAFETTFFHLLNLHVENIKNLEFDPALIPNPPGAQAPLPPVAHGRAVFGEILRSTRRGKSKGRSQLDVYRQLQREHNEVLGHYFRHLYQVLDTVNSLASKGSDRKKYEACKPYADILRAQMSAHELAVLALNCTFGTVDKGKFRRLLIWWKFLEHLPLVEKDGAPAFRDIDEDIQWILYDYFAIDADAKRWLSGAFDKHPLVERFLSAQASAAWAGAVPWQAAPENDGVRRPAPEAQAGVSGSA